MIPVIRRSQFEFGLYFISVLRAQKSAVDEIDKLWVGTGTRAESDHRSIE